MSTNTIETQVSQIENFELFLLSLRYKEGKLVEVEGNKPLLLDNPATAWVVYTGTIDVFAVPVANGHVTGTRRHLFRSGVGQVLFGLDMPRDTGTEWGLLVSGTPGTRLLQMPRTRLWQLATSLEYSNLVSAMLNDWVIGLSLGIVKGIVPKEYVLLETDEEAREVHLTDEQVALPKKGVLWVKCLEGQVQLMDRPELGWVNGDSFLPLTSHTWLRPEDEVRLQVIDTDTFSQQDDGWRSLTHFHNLVREAIIYNIGEEALVERRRLEEKATSRKTIMETTLRHLTLPLTQDYAALPAAVAGDTQEAILTACQLVGKAMNLDIQPHPRAARGQPPEIALKYIVKASRLRMREVGLRDEWWRTDSGPLLALTRGQRPVALLPTSARGYDLVDPAENTRTPVTREVADTLSPIAFSFYRPFPNRPLALKDLVKLGFQHSRRDLVSVFVLGLSMSLLALVTPIATGRIFNEYIPEANVSNLVQVGIGLLMLALTVGIFQIARGVAILRVQSKMDAVLQAAIWDRLLSLPTDFFHRYSAGDLGTRAMGLSDIRRMLSGYILTIILNTLFSVTNLVLLFFYSTQLALIGILLVLVALGVTLIAGIYNVRSQRALQEIQGKVAGTVLQLLTGVIKFRVAGAEHHAFSLWSKGFVEQKRRYYKGRTITNNLAAYNAAYPLITSLVIFAMVGLSSQSTLNTGNFLAFNLAFIQFFNAWFMLGAILVHVLGIIPTYERMQPILQAMPEVDESKRDPGELTGEIEVNHVSFRYKADGPMVLKDVSMHIKPGEFVALVGPSGSGKSTMLRMLLGFAQPESGGIYYDNQDLSDLDLQEVRRQVGVVLQNATLMPGDIYTNLIGSAPNLTIEDAWEATRMAGIEEDISQLPMGMHTVVSERGGNFSGGQRQRLLIARAMINKPRVLFFDEATSALDNRTQDIVSRSLEGLKATRVVIAHRLSTIINADRIYVFDKGEIIQTGSYAELMRQPGPFAELARRQIV
ncbi:MAG: NHLP bacteriocin export ABC transporter permease/ATPase subunit [Anaerolineales bacterium]|nr:NHLP bacteriocin export ABC transporter permease/ATPase subunit [Anaerolineales bacterium]MCB8953035.1 NHLP bacteriocin export ABC transporter permease/ATPase subunit [Ardenticatenales bacterium]